MVRPSRAFKVVEVASDAVLAVGTNTRATIDVLRRIDSIFDVWIYDWDATNDSWRPLTPGEYRAMWNLLER